MHLVVKDDVDARLQVNPLVTLLVSLPFGSLHDADLVALVCGISSNIRSSQGLCDLLYHCFFNGTS